MCWRIKPGYQASNDEAGLAESVVIGSRFDAEKGVADATAALRHLRALPEVDDGVGVIGFCLGGSIAYLVAAQAEIDAAAAELGAVVSFYGSMIPGHLPTLAPVHTPLLPHICGSHPHISREPRAPGSD